jgi:hypothetical protein
MRIALRFLLLSTILGFTWPVFSQDALMRYPLTTREGPYVIHVASFRGPEAGNYANHLAEEIRSRRYGLLAFVYEGVDQAAKKESDALRKAQLDMLGGTETVPGSEEKLKLRTVRVVNEYAVFIGNFPNFEKASEAVKKIKQLEAPQSIPQYGVHLYNKPKEQAATTGTENETLKSLGISAPTKSVQGERLAETQGNPFRQAFACRNPLLHQEVVTQRNDFDPTWIDLNAKERYSIFTCPKAWTLVVARFTPPAVTTSDFRTDVFTQGQLIQASGRGLEVASENGRKLAELLRDGGRGYDAYVFHRRQDTIVTVGAFDARDEKMEQAWKMLCEFTAEQKTGVFSCLMKIPQPMLIPRQK